MGMYDCINFEMNCPNCGDRVTGFQSKDSTCELNTLEPEVVNNFYSNCTGCGKWVELSRDVSQEDKSCRYPPYSLQEVYAMGFRLHNTSL